MRKILLLDFGCVLGIAIDRVDVARLAVRLIRNDVASVKRTPGKA